MSRTLLTIPVSYGDKRSGVTRPSFDTQDISVSRISAQYTDTTQTLYYHFVLPSEYNNADLDIDLFWTADETNGSVSITWQAGIQRLLVGQSVDTYNIFTPKTAGQTSVSQNILNKTIIPFSNAELNGVNAGEFIRLEIKLSTLSIPSVLLQSIVLTDKA